MAAAGPARGRGATRHGESPQGARAHGGADKGVLLLAGTFVIRGASINGLIGTHFVPAAHDHGMPTTAAAGLLAVIGVFDLFGTVASGWFTDRFDSRCLLAIQ